MKVLGELLQDIPCEWNEHGSLLMPIKRIVSDSREVQKGDLFVALSGPNQDGHRYIQQAIECGAVAIMTQRNIVPDFVKQCAHVVVDDTHAAYGRLLAKQYQFPTDRLRLIGVTGTNGKTTTTFLIHYLLQHLSSCGMIGTIYHGWKDKIIEAKNTTPGTQMLMSMMSDMAESGVEFCVMEVSSHGLDQRRTTGLKFHTAIFTNLTQDHLDYHKNFENYYAAKRRLFLDDHQPKCCIVNLDDPYGKRLQIEASDRVIGYGLEKAAAYRALEPQMTLSGTRFQLADPQGTHEVVTNLILRHNIYNTLAAVSAVCENGFGVSDVIPLLQNCPQVPGRMERVDEGQPFHVFVDYAHTPDAVERVLSSVKLLAHGRVITVVGCGGDRDKTKRPVMGRIASRYSDELILTSDNPRSENPESILKEIASGIESPKIESVSQIPDRREAIEKALSAAGSEDVVLILGKGHEKKQIFARETIPFDDVNVAQLALKRFRKHTSFFAGK